MDVFVVGLNHRSAPLWIRERVAYASPTGAARDVADRASLSEALVLSTCNRVECYGAAVAACIRDAAERVIDAFAERASMRVDVLREYLYVHVGDEATRHLARVAAGMDSMVLGETQIVAQIKRALAEARRDALAGRMLDRLVSTAFGAAKRARPLLPAACGVQSVAEAGVHALGGIDALKDRSVVVLGAGDTAADLLRALSGARPRRLVLVNRTLQNALPLAAQHGAAVASWEALGVIVSDADVVFACTSSASPVLLPAHFDGDRARTIVDLGVPRNAHPDVGALPGVRLIDVDRLGAWRPAGHPTTRSQQTSHPEAEVVVAEWADRYRAWLRRQEVLPTIARLRDDAALTRDEEIARTLARLGALGVSGEREREIVRELATRLTNKLLHHPVATLADAEDAPALAEAAHRLFGLRAADTAIA